MTRTWLCCAVLSAVIFVNEALFHVGSDELSALRYSIPGGGIPGEDYPILSAVPDTDFQCKEKETEGYYPDPSTFCQVFHICHQGITWTKDSFLCPNGTIFNTEKNGCIWWYDSECSRKLTKDSNIVPSISRSLDTFGTSIESGFVHKTLPDHQDNAVYRPVSELLSSQRIKDEGGNLRLQDLSQSSASNQNNLPSKVNSALNPSLNTATDNTNTDLSETHLNKLRNSSNSNGFSYSYTSSFGNSHSSLGDQSNISPPDSPGIGVPLPGVLTSSHGNKHTSTGTEEYFGISETRIPSIKIEDNTSLLGNNGPGIPLPGIAHGTTGNIRSSLEIENNFNLPGTSGLQSPLPGSFPGSSGARHSLLGIDNNNGQPEHTGVGIPLPGTFPGSSGTRHSLLGIDNNNGQPETTGLLNPLSGTFPGSSGTRHSLLGIDNSNGQPETTGLLDPLPGSFQGSSGTKHSILGIDNNIGPSGASGLLDPLSGSFPGSSGTRLSLLEIDNNNGQPENIGVGIPLPGTFSDSNGTRHSLLGIDNNNRQPEHTGVGIPLPGTFPGSSGTKHSLLGIDNNNGQPENTGVGIPLPGTFPDSSGTRHSLLGIDNNNWQPETTGLLNPLPGSFPGSSGTRHSLLGINNNNNVLETTGVGISLPGSFPGSSGTRHSFSGIDNNNGQPETTGLLDPLPGSFPGSSGTRHSLSGINNNNGQPESTGVGIPLPGFVHSPVETGHTSLGINDYNDLDETTGLGKPLSGPSESIHSSSRIENNIDSFGHITGIKEINQPEAIVLENSSQVEFGNSHSSLGDQSNISPPDFPGIGVPLPGVLSSSHGNKHTSTGIKESFGNSGNTEFDVSIPRGRAVPGNRETRISSIEIEDNISLLENSGSGIPLPGVTHGTTGISQAETSVFSSPSQGSLSSISSTRELPVQCRQTKPDAELSPELSNLRTNIWGGGVPGVDYPILSSIIRTRFLCQDYAIDGFYADPEACCQVFHRCFNRGRGWWEQESFLCPNGTIFNQKVNTCIRWNEPYWWDGVSCSESERFYPSLIGNETVKEEIVTNVKPTIVNEFDGQIDKPAESETKPEPAYEDPNPSVFDDYEHVGSDGVSNPVEFIDYNVSYNEGSQLVNELSSASNDELPNLDVFGNYSPDTPEELPISVVFNDYNTDDTVGANLNVDDRNSKPISNTRLTFIIDESTSNVIPSNNLPTFAAGDASFDNAWETGPSDFPGRSIIVPTEYESSHIDSSNNNYNEPDPAYTSSVSFGTQNNPIHNTQNSFVATSLDDTVSKENDKTYADNYYTEIGNENISETPNDDYNYNVNINTEGTPNFEPNVDQMSTFTDVDSNYDVNFNTEGPYNFEPITDQISAFSGIHSNHGVNVNTESASSFEPNTHQVSTFKDADSNNGVNVNTEGIYNFELNTDPISTFTGTNSNYDLNFNTEGSYNFDSNTEQIPHFTDYEESTDLNDFINFNNKDNSNEDDPDDYYYDSIVDFDGINPMIGMLSPKPINNRGDPVLDISPTLTLEPSYSLAGTSDANNAFTMWGPEHSFSISATFGENLRSDSFKTESFEESHPVFTFFSEETANNQSTEMPAKRIDIITITSADAHVIHPSSATVHPMIISVSIRPSNVLKETIASTQSTDNFDLGAEFW
ncbi:unnamed protein product [Meganyctiphanes norvegica]|uniref:Chitin-binding type-2 domain-containing protein n=1 Tax=Meganyctiphanes norvegica TaxID=48144 RepID=A0AAV2Q2H4_MEGNR